MEEKNVNIYAGTLMKDLHALLCIIILFSTIFSLMPEFFQNLNILKMQLSINFTLLITALPNVVTPNVKCLKRIVSACIYKIFMTKVDEFQH